MNLERLSQIEQSMMIISKVNMGNSGKDNDKIKDVMMQTIEIELFNIIDSKAKNKKFNASNFFLRPLFIIRSNHQDVDEKSIDSIRDFLAKEKHLKGA